MIKINDSHHTQVMKTFPQRQTMYLLAGCAPIVPPRRTDTDLKGRVSHEQDVTSGTKLLQNTYNR